MYIIFKADGWIISKEGDPTLKEMQEIVGGLVEAFEVDEENEGFVYLCNEEGLLLGLPPNPHFKEIVGDVLYCRME